MQTDERSRTSVTGKISTFTRKLVNPLDMKVEDVDIVDIAHHLSIMNRYTGATPQPYSVAQHSVLCVDLARRFSDLDNAAKLALLLHDAPEAYICDMAHPIKHGVSALAENYKMHEQRITRVIERAFIMGVGILDADFVKHYDNEAYLIEDAGWFGRVDGTLMPSAQPITCWTAREAEHQFLMNYAVLTQPHYRMGRPGLLLPSERA